MKQFLTLAALFGALTTSALAAPAKTSKPTAKAPAKSAAPQCDKCKMTLASKSRQNAHRCGKDERQNVLLLRRLWRAQRSETGQKGQTRKKQLKRRIARSVA